MTPPTPTGITSGVIETPRAIGDRGAMTASTPSPPSRWATLPVLLAALFVVTLDFFIVNVALPSMQRELDAGSSAVTMWVAGYGVAFAALLILGGRLGDRHGRRRMFIAGFGLFTLASAACGAAPDATTLVIARMAQGVGAALLSPQVLATIGVVYDGQDRVRAITAYGLVAGVAAVSGQLIGGALISANLFGLGWRAVFLVNLPVGAAAILAAARCVPETRGADRRPLDRPSVVLVAASLALVVLGLVEGRRLGWPVEVWAALVVADVLLGMFVARQRRLVRRGDGPLIDPALWSDRTFTLGALTTLVFQLGVASSFFVLALELQGAAGLGALDSGLVFTTLAVGYFASSIAAPAIEARIGRTSLVLGAGISAAGEVLLALTGEGVAGGGSVLALVPGLVVAGVGMGLLFAPLVSVTLSTLSPDRAGEASGVVSTVQQLGGAVGVALLGVVFYGVLDGPTSAHYGHAFSVSAWCLAGLAVVVGVLSMRLRAQEATADSARRATSARTAGATSVP
jgi:EmrB/QacA subfamily drug resistance transporter